MEQIEAEYFHGFQTSGHSRPARLTCRGANGQLIEVFIKFAGSVYGHYSGLCSEALCSTVARQLGFLTPDPYIVNLSQEFCDAAPNEAKDLIFRSLGLNFGTVAAGSGYGVMQTEPRLPEHLRKTAAEIYAFDILMQNFDRKMSNPNLLWNRKSIVLIDHECALTPVLQWPSFSLANLELDKFYDHVFYSEISPIDADFQRLISALKTMTPDFLDALFEQLPDVWRDEKALSTLKQYLHFVVDNSQPLCDIIHERVS